MFSTVCLDWTAVYSEDEVGILLLRGCRRVDALVCISVDEETFLDCRVEGGESVTVLSLLAMQLRRIY